ALQGGCSFAGHRREDRRDANHRDVLVLLRHAHLLEHGRRDRHERLLARRLCDLDVVELVVVDFHRDSSLEVVSGAVGLRAPGTHGRGLRWGFKYETKFSDGPQLLGEGEYRPRTVLLNTAEGPYCARRVRGARSYGGGGVIRTREGRFRPLTAFEAVPFVHSGTPPPASLTSRPSTSRPSTFSALDRRAVSSPHGALTRVDHLRSLRPQRRS